MRIEKRHINNNYKKLYRYWSSCAKAWTVADSLSCMKQSVLQNSASEHIFMVNNGTTNLSVDQTKEVEAALLIFVNFVGLSVLATETLAGSYEINAVKNNSSEEDKKHFISSINDQINAIERFKTYAKWAVSEIKRAHNDSRTCNQTVECKLRSSDLEYAIHHFYRHYKDVDYTYNVYDCSCKFDQFLNTNDKCILKYRAIAAGRFRHPPPRFSVIKNANSQMEAATISAHVQLPYKASLYRDESRHFLETFWKNEVLDVVDTWDEVYRKSIQRRDDMKRKLKNEKE